MNKAFTEYTRSCAFTLTLSIRQVEALLWIGAVNDIPALQRSAGSGLYMSVGGQVGTLQTLKRKGLCYWMNEGAEPNKVHGPYLTKAGKLMVDMLKEAGYGEIHETRAYAIDQTGS